MNDSTSHTREDPADLIRLARDGDLSAFRSLVIRYQPYVYALAFRVLGDPDDTADAVQDSFIRIWRNLARYRPGPKFTTWIYTITVNCCYDKQKMDARRNRVVDPGLADRLDDVPSPFSDPSLLAEQSDLKEKILSAASLLPPAERLVFHLRDLCDCTVEEVAEIAGMSPGTVRTNLCLARKRLRLALVRLEDQHT
ncbi:MAG TPA: sigma-70 family RNA polymerase sigma factor [Bacteroidota bacterium]|nr:sigma-70 family RNA polymerase sigma factor [Bacteroidota bacterium]